MHTFTRIPLSLRGGLSPTGRLTGARAWQVNINLSSLFKTVHLLFPTILKILKYSIISLKVLTFFSADQQCTMKTVKPRRKEKRKKHRWKQKAQFIVATTFIFQLGSSCIPFKSICFFWMLDFYKTPSKYDKLLFRTFCPRVAR